jgi:hypothetical protein
MDTRKHILTSLLILILIGCTQPKAGMEYVELPNGHTKIIDYDLKITSYLDHSGRVYKTEKWTSND